MTRTLKKRHRGRFPHPLGNVDPSAWQSHRVLFFEIAPEFTVRSNAAVRGKHGVYTDGAIGARYYF